MRLQVVLLLLLKAILANNVSIIKSVIYVVLAASTLTICFAYLDRTDSTTTPALHEVIADETSLEKQIKAHEASGALSKLDRSSDIKGPDQNLNGIRDDIDA